MTAKQPLPPINEETTWQYVKEKTQSQVSALEKELIIQNSVLDECNNQLKKELEKETKK